MCVCVCVCVVIDPQWHPQWEGVLCYYFLPHCSVLKWTFAIQTHRLTRECAFSASVAEWVNLQSVLMLCDSEGWLQRQDTRRQQRPHLSLTHTQTSHPDLKPSLPWPAQHHLFQIFLVHKSLCWHITRVKDKYMCSVDPARPGSCQRQTEENRNTKDIY